MSFLSLSLLSVIYTKKIKTRKRYVLRTFFLRFVTRTLRSTCFCSQRERERGGVSLSLEQRAQMCDENHCVSFFFTSRKMRNLVSRKGHGEADTSFSESRFG